MNALLGVLRDRTDYVVATDLARMADISLDEFRGALGSLRQQGYEVEDHPDLGYRLIGIPDAILAEEIRYGLRTRSIGRYLHCREVVGSTNDLAADLAADGAPEGTIVLAEQQTAGRGRRARTWHSPPLVGIYLSCILRPPLDPPAFWLVTACASVAVCCAITSASGLKPSVKKPNDVLLAGRKVCGILTEARRDTVILGVGVSVNHVLADFPEELHQVATSIRIESGRKIDRIGLLRNILEELDEGYDQLKKDGGKSAAEKWEAFQGK